MAVQQARTARGYREPFNIQFSIFLANRVGQLKDLLDLLTAKDVKALGVSIVDSSDWSVVRMVFSDANKGREVLTNHRIPFTERTVLLAVLPTDGSLSQICELLLRAEINLVFAYPLTIRREQYPVMVFHVDDDVLASHLLTRHGLTLLGQEDLADPT